MRARIGALNGWQKLGLAVLMLILLYLAVGFVLTSRVEYRCRSTPNGARSGETPVVVEVNCSTGAPKSPPSGMRSLPEPTFASRGADVAASPGASLTG